MRLFELFDAPATPGNIGALEKALDDNYYQPADKVKKNQPVLDVEIHDGPNSHFVQRYNQRAKKADFGLKDIAKLLAAAKTGAIPGYKDELDALSREDHPHDSVVIQDKGANPLTIPVIVEPNPEAAKSTDGNPVAVSRNGRKIPKNQLIPKTVYRKGIED